MKPLFISPLGSLSASSLRSGQFPVSIKFPTDSQLAPHLIPEAPLLARCCLESPGPSASFSSARPRPSTRSGSIGRSHPLCFELVGGPRPPFLAISPQPLSQIFWPIGSPRAASANDLPSSPGNTEGRGAALGNTTFSQQLINVQSSFYNDLGIGGGGDGKKTGL